MSAPEAAVRRLLFVADAAVADVHDLPPEARALLNAAAEVYVVTPLALRSPEHANWQERGLEDRLEKRFGLPLTSYAVDPRGHATGPRHP
jgi:hypothetical protein